VTARYKLTATIRTGAGDFVNDHMVEIVLADDSNPDLFVQLVRDHLDNMATMVNAINEGVGAPDPAP